MVDDLKQFLKFYRAYKKGKKHMDKFKDFVTKHKNELLIAGCGLIIYKCGYRTGFKASQKSIDKIFESAARSLNMQFGGIR